jgi:lipid-binding SYLF domain-containing protein
MVPRLVRALASAALLVLLAGTGHAQSSPQQRLVDMARLTVESFLDDPNQQAMRVYVQNAYGVLIVPEMLKAGFILGVEHGRGVLLARDTQTGAWSDPVFYDLYGGSLGLQLGGQTSDAIFTIMNPAAIDKLMSSRFQLGADASIAAGRVGAGVGAGTTIQFGEDIYVFSRTAGLYGGVSVDGTVVLPLDGWNEAYYGQKVAPASVLRGEVAAGGGADALREALNRF